MGILSFLTSGVAKKVGSEFNKLALITEVKKIAKYVSKNYNAFRQKVLLLVDDTKRLIEQASTPKKSFFAFSENREINKAKETAINNIEYLYLIRDYFILLIKINEEVHLKDDEYTFVAKFTPFFDGKFDGKSVSSLDYDDEDHSLMGELKAMGDEILGEFITTNQTFSFSKMLEGYREKIKLLAIPDVSSVMERFEKTISISEDKQSMPYQQELPPPTSTQQIEYIICPQCQSELPSNSKFCNECGAKIELNRPKFCHQCGASVSIGVKFCSECGTKL